MAIPQSKGLDLVTSNDEFDYQVKTSYSIVKILSVIAAFHDYVPCCTQED